MENKEETKDVVELLDKSVADQEEVHHDEKFDDMLADKSKSVTVIDEMGKFCLVCFIVLCSIMGWN